MTQRRKFECEARVRSLSRQAALLAAISLAWCSAAAIGTGQSERSATAPVTAVPAAALAAGRYRLAGGPDVASELDLRADGTFGYSLTAGALDETAHGRWTIEGRTLRLDTLPRPVPPVFKIGAMARSPDGRLMLRVTAPGGEGIAGVDLRVGFDHGEDEESYTQDYGWTLPANETRTPRWVEFSVPMHGLRSPRFQIDQSTGSALDFVLIPNDLGVVDFASIPMEFVAGLVVMHRNGVALSYDAGGR